MARYQACKRAGKERIIDEASGAYKRGDENCKQTM
jgi:hypothetical protein